MEHCKWRYKAMTVVMALAALLAVGAASAADKKPNILVIWVDDIGYSNISAYNLGLMGYHTPNIDRLAKEDALFTDAYAFTQALYDEAKKEGWTVVSMKDDWKVIFPFETKSLRQGEEVPAFARDFTVEPKPKATERIITK